MTAINTPASHWTLIPYLCFFAMGCAGRSDRSDSTNPQSISGQDSGAAAEVEVIQPPDAADIEEKLRALRAGQIPLTELEIRYSDMHGLHGGETLELSGGEIRSRRHWPRRAEERQHSGLVSPEQMIELIDVLIEIKAWEQRLPPRIVVADQSKSRLSVGVSGQETEIWEWYQSPRDQTRLQRIRGMMDELIGLNPADAI